MLKRIQIPQPLNSKTETLDFLGFYILTALWGDLLVRTLLFCWLKIIQNFSPKTEREGKLTRTNSAFISVNVVKVMLEVSAQKQDMAYEVNFTLLPILA